MRILNDDDFPWASISGFDFFVHMAETGESLPSGRAFVNDWLLGRRKTCLSSAKTPNGPAIFRVAKLCRLSPLPEVGSSWGIESIQVGTLERIRLQLDGIADSWRRGFQKMLAALAAPAALAPYREALLDTRNRQAYCRGLM
ncbi:uncharacterized protein UV8b_03514 [Ustilaginoidea virens]|uniref:Uncharacterized protein n=1 Tax=Ustilaginoidea virens TaxID=1159556 RepID=A0A063C512_USTVR|nr:uncharacterized protein UV8b_03514 [Ustilaginoidea virens]QUC19273.1 hypothetical protein UV8b_03514 [Ustilaginoidea virens]GAO13124.1 hypothetical protein UVI_02024830 [Ustilaginoidea virens]